LYDYLRLVKSTEICIVIAVEKIRNRSYFVMTFIDFFNNFD
jgi:hypothetical protein